jgi:hypothetical protein
MNFKTVEDARDGRGMKNAYLELKPAVSGLPLPEWTAAIFAFRESAEVLAQSIQALLAASEKVTLIDVVINGNERLAQETARLVDGLRFNTKAKPASLRIWQVEQGDKAHAWNQYLYGIWTGAGLAFFIDGYVKVHPHALARMGTVMADDHHALAATGIPTKGRSAEKMRTQLLADSGIHGNLHAIRGATLEDLRRRKFILPLGIYRTDSLIGAAIKFNLDPTQYRWDSHRIRVVADASWDHTPPSAMKPADLHSHFRRLLRQGQGVFENLAVRRHLSLNAQPLETLPETVHALVMGWMENHPQELRRALVKHPLSAFSLQHIKQKRDWSKANIPPRLLTQLI